MWHSKGNHGTSPFFLWFTQTNREYHREDMGCMSHPQISTNPRGIGCKRNHHESKNRCNTISWRIVDSPKKMVCKFEHISTAYNIKTIYIYIKTICPYSIPQVDQVAGTPGKISKSSSKSNCWSYITCTRLRCLLKLGLYGNIPVKYITIEENMVKLVIWQCVKTLYPWWTSK
jgi:hypothetical protein